MQIKFYKYNNLDICPNKLKNATNVETINIDAPQIMQNLGISFLLDRAIEANIAEYWLKGIQYIAYVDYSTSGNNMYTYNLTIDNLATAWYNKCFDRYNMVARSNLGTFKNDNALLRDTQRITSTTPIIDLSAKVWIIVTVLNPVINSYTGDYYISGMGTDTYLLTPEQFNALYRSIGNYQSGEGEPNIDDFVKSIINLYVLPDSLVSPITARIFNKSQAFALYSVAQNNLIKRREFNTETNPKILSNNISSAVYFTIDDNLIDSIPINEDTITGNIHYELSMGGKLDIPITYLPKSMTSINKAGYTIRIDYRTGAYKIIPIINDTSINDIVLDGDFHTSFPFMYDESIYNWKTLTGQFAGTVTNAVSAGAISGALTANPVVGYITAAAGIVGAGINMATQGLQTNASGSTYKFSLSGNPNQASLLQTYITISYTPTVNKQGYQDRFGKADMTSRNITQLTGPVQTINCVASMNNLNQSIIKSATMQCDSGIWIL